MRLISKIYYSVYKSLFRKQLLYLYETGEIWRPSIKSILKEWKLFQSFTYSSKRIAIKSYDNENSHTLQDIANIRAHIDLRHLLATSEGLNTIGNLILYLLRSNNIKPIAIGGPEFGAIPIINSILCTATMEGGFDNIQYGFIIRKTRSSYDKNLHNEPIISQRLDRKLYIDGPIESYDNIVIIDDIVRTGITIRDAIRVCQNEELNILAIICIIDATYDAKILSNISDTYSIPIYSIYTIDQLYETISHDPEFLPLLKVGEEQVI